MADLRAQERNKTREYRLICLPVGNHGVKSVDEIIVGRKNLEKRIRQCKREGIDRMTWSWNVSRVKYLAGSVDLIDGVWKREWWWCQPLSSSIR